MFSDRACLCSVAPVPLGVPLALAGIATLVAWGQQIRRGAAPSRVVAIAGRLGVVTAGILGGSILATELAALPM
jgi:hypothetical protein